VQNLVGPNRDSERVLVLGFYLEGDAHTWFDDMVAAPDRIIRDWTFEEAVLQLHKRFISRVAAIRASEKFFKCSYSLTDGVTGLYNRLNRCARRMVQHPGDYAIRQQFLKALPDEICIPLIEFRSITAENATLTHLRNHAIQVEENNRITAQLGMGSFMSKYTRQESSRRERPSSSTQDPNRQETRDERRQHRRERRDRQERKDQRYAKEDPKAEKNEDEGRRPVGNPRPHTLYCSIDDIKYGMGP